MVFLEYFRFPDSKTEDDFVTEYTSPLKPTPDYYTQNFYPFYVLSNREFYCMDFAPITILALTKPIYLLISYPFISFVVLTIINYKVLIILML